MVIEQSTGKIDAMVGSRTTHKKEALEPRPYPAICPIRLLYQADFRLCAALENGMSPASIIMTSPSAIEGYGGTKGYPSGGLSTPGGRSPMRTAVVKSLNVCARACCLRTTPPPPRRTIPVKMVLIRIPYSPMGPVSPWAPPAFHAGADRRLRHSGGRRGLQQSPIPFTVVTDSPGQRRPEFRGLPDQDPGFQKSTCWLMTDILEDAVKYGNRTKAKIDGITPSLEKPARTTITARGFRRYTGYYTSLACGSAMTIMPTP